MPVDARHPLKYSPTETVSRAFGHGQVLAERKSDFSTNSSKICPAAQLFNFGYCHYHCCGIYIQSQNKLRVVPNVPTVLCLSVGKGLFDIESSPN